MNALLLLNMAAACPMSWRFQSDHLHSPGAVCKLNKQYYSHEEFIGVMCENAAFLKMIEHSPGHDRSAFACNTAHVRVEHSEKTKTDTKFSYNHCERDEPELRKIAKFNNHETDKFCQRYSEQFDYSNIKLHQIANLCKPYYVRDNSLNGKINSTMNSLLKLE